MSTRSVVAIPDGDAWKGRYVHWDGYPTYMAPSLTDLVRRDGLAKVVLTLTESFYGWSTIDPNETRLEDCSGFDAKQFASVVGFGVAYKDQPKEWLTPNDDAGTEWVYILCPAGLLVVKQGETDQAIGLFDWNTDHDWEAIQDLAMVTA